MKFYHKILASVFLFLYSIISFANTEIKSVRIWPSPGNVRVVFDLNNPVQYKIYTLTSPNRVVVDLKNIDCNLNVNNISTKNTKITKIRIGKQANNITRIVFDTACLIKPKSFLLKPNEKYKYRLIVDLESSEKQEILALFDLDQIKNKNFERKKEITRKDINKIISQDFIIAIDAGHGGDDSGAIGKFGTKEKDVTLTIARELRNLINKEKGLRGFLIRDGDYYVGLKDRIRRARKQKADLFISIHADAVANPKVKGGSVFVLSRRGASSTAAKWLAEKENKSDLIGGVSLEDKNQELLSVLLDLSQTANEEASLKIAEKVLNSLKNITPLHRKHVERAGFVVLKSPDIPSVLIETGFISNPDTEKLLLNKKHKERIARNIMIGIKQYFKGKQKNNP